MHALSHLSPTSENQTKLKVRGKKDMSYRKTRVRTSANGDKVMGDLFQTIALPNS